MSQFSLEPAGQQSVKAPSQAFNNILRVQSERATVVVGRGEGGGCAQCDLLPLRNAAQKCFNDTRPHTWLLGTILVWRLSAAAATKYYRCFVDVLQILFVFIQIKNCYIKSEKKLFLYC